VYGPRSALWRARINTIRVATSNLRKLRLRLQNPQQRGALGSALFHDRHSRLTTQVRSDQSMSHKSQSPIHGPVHLHSRWHQSSRPELSTCKNAMDSRGASKRVRWDERQLSSNPPGACQRLETSSLGLESAKYRTRRFTAWEHSC